MITNFEYVEDLHLVRRIVGDGKLFEVAKPYTVKFTSDAQQAISYTVRQGLKTDLASIPAIVPKWVAQKVDSHIEAAVVHDQMCVDRLHWSSKVAAEIFRAAMAEAKVGFVKRWLMYGAVRWLGPQWQ
jgi:hypothetical protein